MANVDWLTPPSKVKDYKMSLTLSDGNVYTYEKLTYAEKSWRVNMDWDHKPWPEERDLGLVFEKQFYKSLWSYKHDIPGETYIWLSKVTYNGDNIGMIDVDISTYEDSEGNATYKTDNIGMVIDPAHRGKGHSKYIIALLRRTGEIGRPIGGSNYVVRHGSVGARKFTQNDIEVNSQIKVASTKYVEGISDYVQEIEQPNKDGMAVTYAEDKKLGTFSPTLQDDYFFDSDITDAKWACHAVTAQFSPPSFEV